MDGDFKVYLTAYHSEVTGSRMMLVAIYPDKTKRKILIDCGYYQEISYRRLNYEDELNPEGIDAVLITHNHIDHTGLLPKLVKNGYKGHIYMTNITKQLLPAYLKDSASQQEENAAYLRNKYPDEAYKFEMLYSNADVEATMKQWVGVDYRKQIELLPDVKVTFFENGHILGAAMILVQISCYKRKNINFLFTGDYRSRNPLFYVPAIPKALRNMELILVTESTYGSTNKEEIKVCFEKNMINAFNKRKHILIGAFAQGRMQEILNRLKNMEKKGLIPPDYVICVDGALGISTCSKYQSIFEQYYPKSADFMPDYVKFLDAKNRGGILDDGTPKIVVSTSGMLSNGPAKEHVPAFIQRSDCMIHLCGYAAEETIARELLDTMRHDEVTIWNNVYQKKATVKTTREFSSHATADQLLNFIRKFSNVRFAVVNHGTSKSAEDFTKKIMEQCVNVQGAGRINRQTMYCFIQKTKRGAKYSDITVKVLPAKLKTVTERKKQLESRDNFKKAKIKMPKRKRNYYKQTKRR